MDTVHKEAAPRKKILSLDALLIPILTDPSRDVGGSELFRCRYGFVRAGFMRWNFERMGNKLFGGREKNPEYTGTPCTA